MYTGTKFTADDVWRVRHGRSTQRLRSVLWLYFFLLIFEGAIRKWIPPLATPFLIVRDPLAIFIWISGYRLGIGDRRVWAGFHAFALIITTLGLLQVVLISANPFIALYGWRSYVLHIPVAIVIAGFLKGADLRKLGRQLLIISIPMTVLMIAQYLAPSASFLNRGVAGDSGQLAGALGHIRPAGTFSFISGPIAFVPLVGSFVLWGFTKKELFPRWLLISSGIAVIIAIPVSVSRSIALMIALLIANAAIGALLRGGIAFKPDRLPQIAGGVILAIITLFGVAQISFVQDAIHTFSTRWTQAEGASGDNSALEQRVFAEFANVLDPFTKVSAIGTGIGAGSSFASAFNGNQMSGFKYGEGSLEREMYELGSWIGPLFLLTRVLLAGILVVKSFGVLYRGSYLAWLLLPLSALNCLDGSLDQTTPQGFLVVSIGVAFAAIRLESKNEKIV